MISPSRSMFLVLTFSLLFAYFTHSTYSTGVGFDVKSESMPQGVTLGQQFDYCVELYPVDFDLASGSVISIFITDYDTGYLRGKNTYVTSRVYKGTTSGDNIVDVIPKICVTLTAPSEAREWQLEITKKLAEPRTQEHTLGHTLYTVRVFPLLTAIPLPTTSSTTTPGAPPGTPQSPPTGGPPPGQPPFPPTGTVTTSPKPDAIPPQISDNFMLILALVIVASLAISAGYLFGKRKSKGLVTCSKCGHTSELDTKFCPECGTKL
jgi:hypothetical protein